MLNKSYVRNNLPPAAHNNAAVMPSRHCADCRNCPCEVEYLVFLPRPHRGAWSRSCAPLLPVLPSQAGAAREARARSPGSAVCRGSYPISPHFWLAGCKSAPAPRLQPEPRHGTELSASSGLINKLPFDAL